LRPSGSAGLRSGRGPRRDTSTIPATTKIKGKKPSETKNNKTKAQKGDTSNRISMGTFLIGLDTYPPPGVDNLPRRAHNRCRDCLIVGNVVLRRNHQHGICGPAYSRCGYP